MKGKQKFFRCSHCGNLIGLIDNSGVPMVCCGDHMTELIPNTFEGASQEKHLPVIALSGDDLSVYVGSLPHPMEKEHYIEFIYVETEHGGQRRRLNPGEKAEAKFNLCGDKPLAVYAYCNIHGLWKTEIK